jgi:hypothetical protein
MINEAAREKLSNLFRKKHMMRLRQSFIALSSKNSKSNNSSINTNPKFVKLL